MARLVQLLLSSLSGFVCLLSDRMTHHVAVLLARIVFGLFGYRRRVIDDNLRAALPEQSETERRALRARVEVHLAETLLEFMRIPRFAAMGFSTFEIIGLEHYERAFEEGRGVLCLTAHLGSFEAAAAAMGQAVRPRKFCVVAKPFSPGVHEFIASLRRRGGVEVIPARGALRPVFAALKRQDAVAFVLDQHAPGSYGVPAEFFGRPAQTLAALAAVAARSRAPVVPTFAYRRADGRHVVQVSPPIPLDPQADRAETVRHMTQVYTRAIEAAIRVHPEQWFWSHRRWKPAPLPGTPELSSRESAAEADAQ